MPRCKARLHSRMGDGGAENPSPHPSNHTRPRLSLHTGELTGKGVQGKQKRGQAVLLSPTPASAGRRTGRQAVGRWKRDESPPVRKPSLEIRGATQRRAWRRDRRREIGNFHNLLTSRPDGRQQFQDDCWVDRNSPPGQGFYNLSWREESFPG